MSSTKIHVNALFLSVLLAVLQGIILWDIQVANGGVGHFIVATPLDKLAIAFAPIMGIAWSMRQFASLSHAE